MPYASDGKIAEDDFEGSIEITDSQYREALEGMCSGLIVSTSNGFKVSPPTAPEPDPITPPTRQELADLATSQRDQLLGIAAIRIAPLQDAVDLNRASLGTLELLAQWKNYRVDLNEVSTKPDFPENIQWPTPPRDLINV